MKKFINLIVKHKYISIAVGILIGCVAVVSLFISLYAGNIVGKAEVSFSGYEGNGTAQVTNMSKLRQEVTKRTLMRQGIKKQDAEALTVDPDNAYYAYQSLSPEDKGKVDNVNMLVSNHTDLKVDGASTGLKNGDKVTVEFNNDSNQIPFRSGKKTFTVSGLKKSKKISAKDVYSKIKVEASGLNGAGVISLYSKNSLVNGKHITIKNNGKLKNGDVINIKLPKLDDGYSYSDSKTFNYKVSGLTTKITNIKEVNDKMFKNFTKKYARGKFQPNFVVLLPNNDYVRNDVTISSSHAVNDNYNLIFNYKDISDDTVDMTQEVTRKVVTVKNNKLQLAKKDYDISMVDGDFGSKKEEYEKGPHIFLQG